MLEYKGRCILEKQKVQHGAALGKFVTCLKVVILSLGVGLKRLVRI